MPRQNKTLILACGALAKEILLVMKQCGLKADLRCLPADYHNHPEKIVPGLRIILDGISDAYGQVLIGYGDCGTGGQLDTLLAEYPKASRLPGAHCYAFYAGLTNFDAMMEEELGSFFLTDYIVRHFKTLIIKGMGLDRFPDLLGTYFAHYKRVVYLSQTNDQSLVLAAQRAAERLGLAFEHRHSGYGAIAQAVQALPQAEAAHV